MTGTKILETALDILNLRTSDGILPDNCADMKTRAVNIINICLAECACLNALICKTEEHIPTLQSLDEQVDFSPLLLNSVIPFGVASYLCIDEDPVLANSLWEKYRVAYKNAQRNSRGVIHPITEVY